MRFFFSFFLFLGTLCPLYSEEEDLAFVMHNEETSFQNELGDLKRDILQILEEKINHLNKRLNSAALVWRSNLKAHKKELRTLLEQQQQFQKKMSADLAALHSTFSELSLKRQESQPEAYLSSAPAPKVQVSSLPQSPEPYEEGEKNSFGLSASFLYWCAENQGNSIAYQQKDPIHGTGTLLAIPSSWDFGFRVGLHKNLPSNGWDILLSWTHFYDKVHTQSSMAMTAGFEGFWPIWMGADGDTFGPFGLVRSAWQLQYNVVDLEMGRFVFPAKTFSIRPLMGVKAGWLYQTFRNRFSERSPFSTDVSALKIFRRSNVWGVGPLAGIDSQWNWTQHLSLSGKFSGALLYGNALMKIIPASVHFEEFGNWEFNNLRNITQHFNELLPTLQWALGLHWNSCFKRGRHPFCFNFDAAWETNYWWVQSNFPVILADRPGPIPPVGTQAVSTEGLSLRLELGF